MTVWKNASKKTALMKPYVRIVDDEEDVRTSMALLLRLAGIDVRTYENAADLLENGEFETPGCLVLDIRMPDCICRKRSSHATWTCRFSF